MHVRLTWIFTYERRKPRWGGIALEIMSETGKTEHCVGFIWITLSQNVCFTCRHFKLFINITPMSVC